MGAGSISKIYARIEKYFMNIDQELNKKFSNNIFNNKNYQIIAGLILEVLLNIFLNLKTKNN